MKVWHISDTHGHHDLLEVPKDIDTVVFSGDESNHKNRLLNEPEFHFFVEWYSDLDIPNKIMIAGNHSSFIYNYRKAAKRVMYDSNVIYLDHDYIEIDGVKFFGDPFTPTFNDWFFMSDRSKMDRRWADIDEDTDVVITHGPPFSILDTSINRNGSYDLCGDKALGRHIRRVNPFLHLFGHIHDIENIVNFGIREIDGVRYSNGAVVKDNEFGSIFHNGTVLEV